MKIKVSLFFAIVAISLSSCFKDDNCDPDFYLTHILKDKTIESYFDTILQTQSFRVVAGENLVFSFDHIGPQCDNVFDDEWGEILNFEIEPGIESFDLIDEQLLQANASYRETGAWVNHQSYPVKDGFIKGKKEGNIWIVEADIIVDAPNLFRSPVEVSFHKIFK